MDLNTKSILYTLDFSVLKDLYKLKYLESKSHDLLKLINVGVFVFSSSVSLSNFMWVVHEKS